MSLRFENEDFHAIPYNKINFVISPYRSIFVIVIVGINAVNNTTMKT
jgi:hypothetical protein